MDERPTRQEITALAERVLAQEWMVLRRLHCFLVQVDGPAQKETWVPTEWENWIVAGKRIIMWKALHTALYTIIHWARDPLGDLPDDKPFSPEDLRKAFGEPNCKRANFNGEGGFSAN